MSVKVMSMVFDRYPHGGGEFTLALALADHASDDGTKIFPSVASLAKKTRQSERTVQYQLRKMEEAGWLVLVSDGGGRYKTREYAIAYQWIGNGANFAPLEEKGATDDRKGAIHDRKGATDSTKGCKAFAPKPSYNHQITVKEPSIKKSTFSAIEFLLSQGVEKQVAEDWLLLRKKAPPTKTAIDGVMREAVNAGMTLNDALAVCCERGWRGFKAEWVSNAKPVGMVNAGAMNKQQALEQRNAAIAEAWARGE